MKTDTSEKGLERLNCTALTGAPCDPGTVQAGAVREPGAPYGGSGWICGDPNDYDREYAADLVQLRTFLAATQPKAAEALDLDQDSPTRRKFLARLQGEISKRGVIDILRHGVIHGPVGRKEVDEALVPKLPDRLTDKQKQRKAHNLLQELRRSGSIANQGTRSHPEWVIVEPPRD